MPNKKQNFRKQCKQNTNLFHAKKYAINTKIFQILETLKARNILLYCPLKTEVNIFPLIYKLKKRKCYKIFIPKVTGVSFDVVEFNLPLKKNKYGISECNTRIKQPKIDVMIVPILGMDSSFRRIGFGKGMYDRFFAKLKIKPKIIFITKKLYFSKDIITQEFDIQGDYLISNFYSLKRIKNEYLLHDRFFRDRLPRYSNNHFFYC